MLGNLAETVLISIHVLNDNERDNRELYSRVDFKLFYATASYFSLVGKT